MDFLDINTDYIYVEAPVFYRYGVALYKSHVIQKQLGVSPRPGLVPSSLGLAMLHDWNIYDIAVTSQTGILTYVIF